MLTDDIANSPVNVLFVLDPDCAPCAKLKAFDRCHDLCHDESSPRSVSSGSLISPTAVMLSRYYIGAEVRWKVWVIRVADP